MAKKKTQKTAAAKAEPKRRLLTDRQVHIFVKAMREFGYPSLTFEEARRVANEVAEGRHSPTNVIALMLVRQLDDAEPPVES